MKIDRHFWHCLTCCSILSTACASNHHLSLNCTAIGHKAIVVSNVYALVNCIKRKEKIVYRNKTPDQHAAFLNSAASLEFDLPQTDIQAAFNHFYSVTVSLLNHFYPEKTIMLSSRDPDYITPAIKAKLRRKHKLMRAGRVEEASALAKIIGKDIVKKNSRKLNRIQGAVDSKNCGQLLDT